LKLRYLTIPIASLSADVELSDAEIEDYYAEHAAEFMTEEQASMNYLELSIDMLAPDISEDQLQAEYQRRIDAMPPAIERHAAHIMLSSLDDDEAQTKLADLKRELEAGADFADLAEAHSEDPGSAQEGGDLGFTTGDAFPEEFEEALAALETGAVSDPVQTESGWHLIKLLDVREMARPGFEELRLEIETALQREAAEPLFVEQSEKLADLTFNSENLQEAADALGLVVQTTDLFGRDGGQGVFTETPVIRAAFSEDVLERDMNSEMIELGGEHVVVIHKSEHRPARQRDLAEVRPLIESMLKEVGIRALAEERAAALLSAAEAGESIESLANDNGYDWQLINAHRRGADGIAVELSDAAFGLKRSGAQVDTGSVSLANGDAVVFQVSEFRQGPTSSMPDQQRTALARIIEQGRGRAMAIEYQGLLRERADVKLL